MKQSDRIIKEHADRLARLPLDQRETVLNETARLLERLRLVTRFDNEINVPPMGVRSSDGDSLLPWLKSQPSGSRITKVSRPKD